MLKDGGVVVMTVLAGFVLVGRKCLRRIDVSVHGDMELIRSDCAMWGR